MKAGERVRLAQKEFGSLWRRAHTDGWLQEPPSRITRQMIASVYEDPTRRPLTVCFTGHRQLNRDLLPDLQTRLQQLLEELYRKGYRDFMSGGALGFDLLAAEHVLQLRKAHPDVRLIMVLPCSNQAMRWNRQDSIRYERILYDADETRVLSSAYYQGCMLVRNRHMVNHSSLCVCYMLRLKGGTVSTVAYAMQQDVPVINLAMDTPSAYLRDGFQEYEDN